MPVDSQWIERRSTSHTTATIPRAGTVAVFKFPAVSRSPGFSRFVKFKINEIIHIQLHLLIGLAMTPTQLPNDEHGYKESMYKTIAELFEKIGVGNPAYSEMQKATDILEVLSTLLAFTIYNSCPNTETIRDASEASYFQIKQMALGYFYQQQKQNEDAGAQNKNPAARPGQNLTPGVSAGSRLNSNLNRPPLRQR